MTKEKGSHKRTRINKEINHERKRKLKRKKKEKNIKE